MEFGEIGTGSTAYSPGLRWHWFRGFAMQLELTDEV
jgi:hypothetical protein